MTDKAAIRELREKVEKKLDTAHDHARVFPSESAYGHCTWHDSHKASTAGSLDAALALHEAVLPGWVWELWPVNSQEYGCMVGNMAAVFSVTPARAWLLAVLKAMEND